MLDKIRFIRISPGSSEGESESNENECVWWPCLLYSNYSDLVSSVTSKKLKIALSSERFKHHRYSRHYSTTNKVATIVGKCSINSNRRMKFVSREDESDMIKDFFDYEGQMEKLYYSKKDWCDAFAKAHQIMDHALEDGNEVEISASVIHITADSGISPQQTKSNRSEPSDSVSNVAHSVFTIGTEKLTSQKTNLVGSKHGKEFQNSRTGMDHLCIDQSSQPIESIMDLESRKAEVEHANVPTMKNIQSTKSKIPPSDKRERIENLQSDQSDLGANGMHNAMVVKNEPLEARRIVATDSKERDDSAENVGESTLVELVEVANRVDHTMSSDETKRGTCHFADKGSISNCIDVSVQEMNKVQRQYKVSQSSPAPRSHAITMDDNTMDNRLVTPDAKNFLARSRKGTNNDVMEEGKTKQTSPIVHEIGSAIQTDMTFAQVVKVLTHQFGWKKLKGGNSLNARFYYYIKGEHSTIRDPSQLHKLCKVDVDYFKGDNNLKIWLRKNIGWVESKGFGKPRSKGSKKRNNEACVSLWNTVQSRKKAKIVTISPPQSSRRRSSSFVDKPRKVIRKRDDFGTAWDILLHSHGWKKISSGPILSNSGYIYLHGKHKADERVSGAFCLKYLERKKDYFVEDEELKEYMSKKHNWLGPEGKEFNLSSTEVTGRTRRMSRDIKD